MSEQRVARSPTRSTWSEREIAFVFYYIDVCNETGKDYRATVLTAIQKFSQRKIQKIVSLENQLRKLLRDWGKAAPSLAPLLVEGSAHLKGIPKVPEGVQMELKRMQAKLNANRHLDDTEEGNEDVLNADELEVAQTDDDEPTGQKYDPGRPNERTEASRNMFARGDKPAHNVDSLTPHIAETPEPATTPPVVVPGREQRRRPMELSNSDALSVQLTRRPGRATGTSEHEQQQFSQSSKTLSLTSSSNTTPTVPERSPNKKLKISHSTPIASSSLTELVAPVQSDNPQGEPLHDTEKTRILESRLDTLQMQVDILLGVSRDVMGKVMDEGGTFDKATRTHLRRLFDDTKDPNTFNSRQQDDLRAAIRTSERLKTWQQQLVKGADVYLNVNFPEPPNSDTVENLWHRLATKFRRAIGLRDEKPDELPTPESAGYLTARIEDILMDRLANCELEGIAEEVKDHVKSPYAVLALSSAVFCRDLFRSPEPMCSSVAPSLMVVYDMQRQSQGIAAVQHLDMIVTKILFDKPEHRLDDQKRAANILVVLNKTLRVSGSDLDTFGDLELHESWVMEAVKLKKELMISPNDYRIHVSKAGSAFDPAWMIGVGQDGRPVDGRNIGSRKAVLCLFPAILRLERQQLGDDANITDALVSHRKFLPTRRERSSFEPQRCIAKAIVLVM